MKCEATTWRGATGDRFGPGGYNRCAHELGHDGDYHLDDWGHVFVVVDGRTKILRRTDTNTETAGAPQR